MTIFTDKDTKAIFINLAIILLLFIVIGQLIATTISQDYKQMMFSHDYAIAGSLEKENVDETLIKKAFSSINKNENTQTGRKLLQSAGYNSGLSKNLLTDVKNLHSKYSFYLFLLSFMAAAYILFIILYYLLRQEKKLKKATSNITSFMSGNTDVRLDQHEEGSLSKLFNSINGLATSLNSHIISEKQNKEFLKETISNISHQLKTPLAALRMYNEILQSEQTENEVITDFLNKTDRELSRMDTLIQNLLKLARLDSGMIIMDKKRNSVKRFLEEVLESFRTRAKNENKQLRLECDELMTLSFDEDWLYEAVSNIIKNAFDHTPTQGQITLIAKETPVLIEIIIKDDGVGIHPEDIHQIFKRFYRSRFSKDKQGVGIGLTLSKMIIERHDGSVFVESEFGKGTSFSIVFPKLTNM